MKILGIWDGHDAGAALIEDGTLLFAINEERLTRRKLEISFPVKSIEACLCYTDTSKEEISEIGISTADVAKTLTRVFPSLGETYYNLRRRKSLPGIAAPLKKKAKYKLTEYPPNFLTRWISTRVLHRRLSKMGFHNFHLHLWDHHLAHAATAAFTGDIDDGVILTLDGLGDGSSGSIYRYNHTGLELVTRLSARHSLGIFFEHATNLLNMRELEDEGKVMALANYAYPVDDAENPLMDLIQVKGLSFCFRYGSLGTYRAMKKILWQYPSEQFAFMAQRTLERRICEWVEHVLNETGCRRLGLAGGVFSNVKVNRLIRMLPDVAQCYVFPHMGDGGLALGAALITHLQLTGIHRIPLNHFFHGPGYSDKEVEDALKASGLCYEKCDDLCEAVASIIADDGIVLWFQGQMELGPRALGGRSILARPDSPEIKDTLNLRLKKRVWYQPFCPTMLEEDAQEVLEGYQGDADAFMTMAYMVRSEKRSFVQGVINIDGSCRPQILGPETSLFRRLLLEIKRRTGYGIVLNTSLNVHGEPLVCSPEDAIKTMVDTGCRYMAIGSFLVQQVPVD